MFTRLAGALLRAILIVLVILTPSLLVPGANGEDAKVITLAALAFAAVTLLEYGAKFPALIEFRDAPPFNRIRIIAMMLTLFGLSIIIGVDHEGTTLSVVMTALGLVVGRTLDFPFSPLRLVLDHLPENMDAIAATKVQSMAGLAVLIAMLSLFIFSIMIRSGAWPNRASPFNVWINLPTFDPTAGGDVITRLNRDGRVNVIFGIFSPFVIPVVAVMAANQMGASVVGSPQTMVWAITIWMFLPLSLLMRGMAMIQVARMIRARRARLIAGVDADAPKSALPS